MDKPLHVRVAEALGWRIENLMTTEPRPTGWGIPPGGEGMVIPRYDTDWSATGQLIEKYGLTLTLTYADGEGNDEGQKWMASGLWTTAIYRPTPLLAVCAVILALAEAGKLEPQTANLSNA